MDKQNFPAWYYGPEGKSEIFHSENEVPRGWVDHPAKLIAPETTGSQPFAPAQDAAPAHQRGAAPLPAGNDAAPGMTGSEPANGMATDQTNTLDRDGWPWSAELHAATKSLTKDDLWRMKVGVSRPDPKPGFPKPNQPLDL